MNAFKCMPKGFDGELAKELGRLVAAAYDQFHAPMRRPSMWPLAAPYRLVREFSAAPPAHHQVEKFGFVARREDNGNVYVIFRGTASPGDWLANLDFVHEAQRNGWGNVEKGFGEVYAGCADNIIDALRKEGNPPRVFISGHSLGGALSTLCAADVKFRGHAATTLYTFASPRTGDSAFAAEFNRNCPDTFRIVNTEDIVNTVPLAATAISVFNLGGLRPLLQGVGHLKKALAILDGVNFEHVGTPADFTVHKGNIVDNHAIETYLAAL
jgi:hypothetical protein